MKTRIPSCFSSAHKKRLPPSLDSRRFIQGEKVKWTKMDIDKSTIHLTLDGAIIRMVQTNIDSSIDDNV
ncbi:unnamed protein product [Acanthoscelides obtectus]|uniref:Uncharacterized protein n=1 Tax=Acanthoscelides obtectus TaxID=200917 RepID=A0A9P0PU70_ACAOB|nr:unnamed protein product [Acanthoscelides obtectus]CAK1667094.1 hypothetical protein AOBTE_LOCUS25678 [Acanthoscelides obtectus]